MASQTAENFASEFDGLSIGYPKHVSAGRQDRCLLDAALATRSIHPATVHSYEWRVSETLCPVGTAASSHLTLMITPSGRLYGGYDAWPTVLSSGYGAWTGATSPKQVAPTRSAVRS
ncbi:SUKH-3 domain-containing protein [Streptosporangium sp. NPDC051023]|uniref:SUKH-3 domain-containing protein n=1 Tax=Streptosporangium sp. NPDC051023 TaxID=3155410 RepID=UPI00344FB26A